MASLLDAGIERLRGWAQKQLDGIAPAPPAAATPAPDLPAAADLARRTFRGQGGFSVTWDDVAREFRAIGPQTYLYPSIGWQDDQLDRLLRASAWSWASANGNSRAISQLTPIVQERAGGKWTRADDSHPLWKFLRAPTGTDPTGPRWDWSKLAHVTGLHYYVAGNGFWVPSEAGGRLFVTPIMMPHKIQADENRLTGFPTLYKLQRPKGISQSWTPGEIVNIQAPSAASMWKGVSPIHAAMTPIEIDHVATERQRYSLRNQAVPGLTVMSSTPWGNSSKQRQEIYDEVMTGYTEMVDTGKPWVLSQAQKIERGFSPEELKVFDTKRSSQAEIMAVIGTQPSVLGQLDRATYSNTKEATILWWFGSIQPVTGTIFGDVNTQLVAPRYPDARIWYQLAGTHIGLQLLDAMLELALKYSRLGLSTADIGRLLDLELPDRDYLEVPVSSWVVSGRVEPERIAEVISQLQQLSETPADPEPDAAPDPEPVDTEPDAG